MADGVRVAWNAWTPGSIDTTGYSPHIEEKGIVLIYHILNPSKNLNSAGRRSRRSALGGRRGHGATGSRQTRCRHKGIRWCTMQAPQVEERQEPFHWMQIVSYWKMKPEKRKKLECSCRPVCNESLVVCRPFSIFRPESKIGES